MTPAPLELMRLSRFGNWWIIELLSAATGRWIVVAEHKTKHEAERDLIAWRKS